MHRETSSHVSVSDVVASSATAGRMSRFFAWVAAADRQRSDSLKNYSSGQYRRDACPSLLVPIATKYKVSSALVLVAYKVSSALVLVAPYSAFFSPGVPTVQNGISVDRMLVPVQMKTTVDSSPLLRCWASRSKVKALEQVIAQVILCQGPYFQRFFSRRI